MYVKVLTLLLGFGVFVSQKVQADVDAIYFQLNLNGEVVDMGATGTDESDFSDLLEEIQDLDETLESENEADDFADEEEIIPVSSVPTRELADNTSNETTDCNFNSSGETDANCVCPADGSDEVVLRQSGSAYVCCNMTQHKMYVNGSYSKVFMPICGCLDGYRVSFTDPFDPLAVLCCQNGNLWHNTLEQEEPTGVYSAVCDCRGNIEHCTQEVCEGLVGDGRHWCSVGTSGGWCTTEVSCQTECSSKGGQWCASQNKCMNACDKIWDESTCTCQERCSTANPAACGVEEDCKRYGGHWCYTTTSTEASPQYGCRTTECCSEGNQQASDGNCYPCPEDGSMAFLGEEGSKRYICCRLDASGTAYTKYTNAQSGFWYAESLCGCPANGSTETKMISGVCCSNGYSFDGTGYKSTSDFEICGCPDGGVFKEKKGICCKDQRPFVKGAYSTQTDFVLCGCADGKVWDASAKKCVECLSNDDCDSGYYCNINAQDSSKNKCASCVTFQDCAAGKVCNEEHQCVDCPTGTKYSEGHCYECLSPSDCTTAKPFCDLSAHTCGQCQNVRNQEIDDGCDARKPYCIQSGSERICSECWNNQQCERKDASKPFCNVTKGRCESRECVADWACTDPEKPRCNRQTGECVAAAACADGSCACSSEKPVWNIYETRCVTCYDSISADWTDLGCPDDEPTAADVSAYSARRFLGTEHRRHICLVNSQYPEGRCVECLENSHCFDGEQCIDYMCKCPDGGAYDFELKQCGCPQNQCRETTSTGFTCVNMADYDDVERKTDGTCKKKDLSSLSFEKTGTFVTNAGWTGNGTYRKQSYGGPCDRGYMYELRIGERTLKLKYAHSATLTTDWGDDCTFGSNLFKTSTNTEGEVKQVDSDSGAATCAFYTQMCAKTGNYWSYCQYDETCTYSRHPEYSEEKRHRFKTTQSVQPGIYKGVYVYFRDLFEYLAGMPGGTAKIKFNDKSEAKRS